MSENGLQHLIKILAGLPALGPRSARRIALHMITKKQSVMEPLIQALSEAEKNIKTCDRCGNLDTVAPCSLCQSHSRDKTTLCIVASVADIWAIERTGHFKGLYHVLGGVLSSIDGIRPEDLGISDMLSRIDNENIQEVILALSATVNGQTTSHYIADRLEDKGITITGLARGIPVGGELDYLDDSTITTAFKSRKEIA